MVKVRSFARSSQRLPHHSRFKWLACNSRKSGEQFETISESSKLRCGWQTTLLRATVAVPSYLTCTSPSNPIIARFESLSAETGQTAVLPSAVLMTTIAFRALKSVVAPLHPSIPLIDETQYVRSQDHLSRTRLRAATGPVVPFSAIQCTGGNGRLDAVYSPMRQIRDKPLVLCHERIGLGAVGDI
jgi:hypothetical protein